MLERMILILNYGDAINMYQVQHGIFKMVSNALLVANRDIAKWLRKNGYERIITFEPDDGVSGLYKPDMTNWPVEPSE